MRPTRMHALVAGLVVAATASHLCRVLAGSSFGDLQEIDLAIAAGVYLAVLFVGAGLGGALFLLERLGRLRGVAFVAVVALLELNLGLLVIAYGVGGDLAGFALAELLGWGWPGWAAGIALVVGAVAGGAHLSRGTAGRRWVSVAAWILVGAALGTDALEVGSMQLRRPRAVQWESAALPPGSPRPTVVHVIFDELSAPLLEEHAQLTAQAFFRHEESGIYHRAAYTNSLWTHNALPQLLSGEVEPEPSQRYELFRRAHRAGYALRLYLASGPVLCEEVDAESCRSEAWAWQEAIYAGDRASHVAHQLRLLGRLYIRRILGSGFVWARNTRERRAEIHQAGESPTRVLFDAFRADLRASRPPTYFFVHLLLPHAPFVHARDCQLRGDASDLRKPAANEGAAGYVDQMYCANQLIGELLSELRSLDAYDSTFVILQSDHGAREELFERLDRGDLPEGGLEATTAALVERSSRMLLWMKPPGRREARETSEPIELHELCARILGVIEIEGCRAVSEADGRPSAEREMRVIASEVPGAGPELVRSRARPSWRVEPGH